MSLLEPDRYFSRLSHIDITGDLLSCGFAFVLLDIDNTVLSRATHDVPGDVASWLTSARAAGVSFCLLSNNWHASVFDLAAELDMPIVAKALKPLPHGFYIGMKRLGSRCDNTVCIGDQLITDVFGAHLVGMAAYMLQPLVEQDLWHTRFLRRFERVVLGDRQPEPATSAEGRA